MATVTVVVVSWNTRELLADCLDSLRADHEAGRVDVHVVDNGSTDGSPELVAERFGWVTLDEPGTNLGFGRAVNRIARRTRSPWVAAANSDLRFEPGALAALCAAGDAHPEAGVLGPRLILPDGSTQRGVQPFPTATNALLLHSKAYRLSPRIGRRLAMPGRWDPESAAEAPWVTGALLLVRRSAWDAVGGFDERQWMYAEDIDLCWQVRRAGFTVRYEPSALVHHVQGPSVALAFGSEADVRWLGATYAWVARRRGPAPARCLAAVNLVEATLRSLVVGRSAPEAAATRRRRGAHTAGLLRPREVS